MQLGELQKHQQDFAARGARMIAISVDPVETSQAWAKKRSFDFEIASDPELKLIDRFGLRNPHESHDESGLALHAIYIVDEQGEVFYRKIARRRAKSDELLDALDFKLGRYKK